LDAEPLLAGASYDCKPRWRGVAKKAAAEPGKLTIRSTGTIRIDDRKILELTDCKELLLAT